MELLREKSTDRFRAGEAIAFQIGDLLALRCEDVNDLTGFGESGFDFPQGKTFARPRAAAKQRDEIARGQNMFHRLCPVHNPANGLIRLIIGGERFVLAHPMLSQPDDVQTHVAELRAW